MKKKTQISKLGIKQGLSLQVLQLLKGYEENAAKNSTHIHLNEMDQFFENHKLLKLTQDEIISFSYDY